MKFFRLIASVWRLISSLRQAFRKSEPEKQVAPRSTEGKPKRNTYRWGGNRKNG